MFSWLGGTSSGPDPQFNLHPRRRSPSELDREQTIANLIRGHMLVSMLALSLHAYTPAMRLHTSLPSRPALNAQRPPLMIVPKGNSDPNFDPDNVDPDAVRRTVVKTGVVWVVVGGIVALVTSSGKEFSSANAPGLAEASAKKAAAKKASLEAYNARIKDLEARRDSGAPPSRPWDK